MHTLFIDTSFNISVALLDNGKFVKFSKIQETKSSQIIHSLIYDLLNSNDVSIKDIKQIVYCAGPGSYTGIRIAKGIADTLGLSAIKVHNYWLHEIITDLEYKNTIFISDAFKKQIFLASDLNVKTQLIEIQGLLEFLDLNNVEKIIVGGKVHSLYKVELEKFSHMIESSDSVIEQNIEKIVDKSLREKRNKDVFYYRTLEEEFNRPKI